MIHPMIKNAPPIGVKNPKKENLNIEIIYSEPENNKIPKTKKTATRRKSRLNILLNIPNTIKEIV